MRIIIGGAYNGKREFVKKILIHIPQNHLYYYEGTLPTTQFSKDDYLIIGNFENIIKAMAHLDEIEIADSIMGKLKSFDSSTNLICICTDVGRGIVPIEAELRKIRDACGRLYQRLFEESETVVRIWYGIPQYIKGSVDNETF
ncbi:bifunctional adenosylcobinamide kinase/adenosylcobinamide-phosphate guanylyltransferase [Lysinibacillus sp. BW-2-10]|uniref:bifunctional adenosylcobinamide kinase/adenosylcobinamide-phosphate guanylyltransferase n=1 Tax=Lysinibacillus sp. BW-2-10 TaxID=2590030 RepID=UPI00117E50FD|nr:bifunctional adenosylcobinamide kinase/adenosylcobinamide-phosphate guanylyltransferase [Lysinibacillus sp. BW-2-10]TSI03355.1 adenosylcobinamide kinase [Lysinibacillus sp. BW-2-10]